MLWQVDFYRRPLRDEGGQPLWELAICDRESDFIYTAFCPQAGANSSWLAEQLQIAIDLKQQSPERLQVFRPQALSLVTAAAQKLGIGVEATRRTSALKQLLQRLALDYPQMASYSREAYNPVAVDRPPPAPMPENLWGEEWRFAAVAAGDLEAAFAERPIPVRSLPESLLPLNLGLASTALVPGVIIYGGRQSLPLARWLDEQQPAALNYAAGNPAGLVLEAGLADRWIVATFDAPEAIASAQNYRQRQQQSQGLHFLLVQPDDSGMTYSGFWLLCSEEEGGI